MDEVVVSDVKTLISYFAIPHEENIFPHDKVLPYILAYVDHIFRMSEAYFESDRPHYHSPRQFSSGCCISVEG